MSSRAEVVAVPDHTLLRVIGSGSYGEVWLARNVMGTLRAVKIVRRAAFDSDRPWLREFEGIRRCEPVSRAHDGLIDILHVGRNDAGEFFYYVMELADDAGGGSESDRGNGGARQHAGAGAAPLSVSTFAFTDSYSPATLAARLTGNALPVPDCLRLAESLAGALAFLHEQGLIHRDVKPSNILYTGGVPKLGDIGLVAEAGSSRSFVGTEGFVPLEGPGTERADIFALGKVLYESLTGLDRGKFPRLPEWWAGDPEFDQRVELNEIVLRACEGDPVRRYHTAREMLADVALVASGRSLKKLRGMERRLKTLRWTGLAAAVVAVLALTVSWMVNRQADRERALRLRAEQAEYHALLNQVRAARRDTAAGAVTQSLKVASEAAAAGVTPELRDDAIFLLSRDDFVMRPDLAFTFTHPCWTIAADQLLMAEMPLVGETAPDKLEITLHTAGAPAKRRTITVDKPPPLLSVLRFSGDAKRLLVTGKYGGGMVLDTASGRLVHPDFFPAEPCGTPLTFCGDKGDAVVRRASEGGLAIFSLPDGTRRTTPKIAEWPVREQGRKQQRLWPSPDGRFVLLIDEAVELPGQLATGFTGAACLVDTADGSIEWKFPGVDEQVAAWSPDGTRVAVRRGDFIVSLDADSGEPAACVPQRIVNRGTQLAFIESRNLLVFSTWSMAGLCDMAREERLGHPPVLERWNYGRERRLLFAATGVAEWRPSPVLRILHPPRSGFGPVFFSWSADDQWLITGLSSRFCWWRLENNHGSTPDAVTAANSAAQVLFYDGGKRMELLDNGGRHALPWTGSPPEELPDPLPYGPGSNGRSHYAVTSFDGRTTAFGGDGYVIVRREGADARSFPAAHSTNPIGLSPDGRWLAIGAYLSSDMRIFDLWSGAREPVHIESCGPGCFPCFSPDGKWLACSSFSENRVLAVPSWNLIHRRPCESSALLGFISFSRDGRLMSVRDTPTRIAILEPGSWRTLYHLDAPLQEIFERNGLSPGGRYFAAVGTRQEVYVWDLHAIRVELRRLGISLEQTGTDDQ